MLKLDSIETLGDWNPQLLRELQGRLKPRNLILAGAISLCGQLLLFITFLGRLPKGTLDQPTEFPQSDPYCTGFITYGNDRKCLADAAGELVIDWQKWSLDWFLVLSIIGIFGLIVAGTYLLIDNLAYEERNGTLNFIRLSPRSPQNILWGKMLGVPILLYVVALLAAPLHLWAGFAAHISLIRILSFYGILAISCLFFYSFSLLFGLINFGGLSRFQALLGSGIVFLVILVGSHNAVIGDPLDWLKIFSPILILQYLIAATGIQSTALFLNLDIQKLQWFNLPIGMGIVGIASILTFNYSFWTYWAWQAIQRRFLSSSQPILSKGQSYLLVACFEIIALGFATYDEPTKTPEDFISALSEDFATLVLYNFVLYSYLIITLTPQRQAVIDWARYRNQKSFKRRGLLNSSLLRDLVWNEKSPAIVAIAINAAITFTILISWIVVSSHDDDKLLVLMSLVLNLSLIMVCAAISQLVALMQTQKPGLWIIGTLGAVIILSPLIIGLLSINSVAVPTLVLLTVFAVAAVENAGIFSILLALLAQLSLLTLCCWQINRQLKKAGASNSVGLFTTQPKVKPTSD